MRSAAAAFALGLTLGLALGAAVPAGAAEEAPRTLYLLRCSGCHGLDGSGSKAGRVPGLSAIGRILAHRDGALYLANVPGVENAGLSPAATARLLNWAVGVWGGLPADQPAPTLTGEQIGRLRKVPVDDLVALRARIAADLAARGIDIGSYSGN
ncbi:hypothetical protein SAMN06265365_10764 [Tistlia consotensis]|uniref:Cytochrome c domain-containing protein n=1 Tax=Tistlia consotensis USBA 355 TaxID=560819 RepID=A0A1Y6B7N7_9PROT|nr:hypothetical protein [Tistlia consotensis]SME97294.1 hypothetical protein SAMN05428998_10264 [Tistlia consotensis USBA 355]SNR56674.1 hypothetical protein SAMN06265365_10764 [Tistlia consotensis]